MSLSIGIVGLPNVGKSTLFNVLTSADILTANYPFATIEPNTGIVPVPDERLDKLASLYNSDKIVPAAIKFIDIAGLVAGASKGEGLGNQFLANIREVDAIVHVVRAFEDKDIVHVLDTISPEDDIDTINTELALADIDTLEKVIPRLLKESKGAKEKSKNIEQLLAMVESLKSGDVYKNIGVDISDPPLLTTKPTIYVFNVSEDILRDKAKQAELSKLVAQGRSVFISARLEEELSKLEPEEKAEFLASYNIKVSGLDRLVKAAYDTLKLQSFLTAGKKEVRAWTIKQGATAKEAAGVIHTDFAKGFIAAQVINYHDLIKYGSESAVRAAGLIHTEGKDYVMQPDDVVEFRFNV
jgi:GTP-binding protein YchF